ncbi:ABC-type phosphate/phosphonate transport system, ATPase component [Cenarchaeum symbiosum A]|uniref:ABC-type phosphate/phosphonate transport system, ATPase component n=1 Tax=Cenarchaeum symbiosum (strain A) TaxID=414004 RepID=A0RX19_CENSY|nr:ABC-type phosphate/phosphonate transport system, ATPase component [Cenarchaeum symbiosum A]
MVAHERILSRNVIQLNDVWASYDSKTHVLRGVSLSVARGSNYAIIGQSGSGKSSLLRLINGMMAPARGRVMVDYVRPGQNNREFRRMMPQIGYIPQGLGLVDNLTVLGNALIGALPRTGRIKSMLGEFPEAEVEAARRILGMVGLGSKSDRKAHMLSGGERRRVAIARALVQRPEVLLADEMVSELDRSTATEIMDLVRDAQERFGLTAVMVHHDVGLALEYADRVAMIKEGRKELEIGVEGDRIVDFESSGLSQEEILEMYGREP